MTSQMIPHEALKAATGALWDAFESGVSNPEEQALLALKAAAPDMLAEAWDAALQDADDVGYLREHQTEFMKKRNPYRSQA